MSLQDRMQRGISHFRWALAMAISTCPTLAAAYGIISLVLVFVPAAVALSVRGLVNSVSDALTGTALGDTNAWLWLAFGLAATLAGSVCTAAHRYFNQALSIELGRRLRLDILCHHETLPFGRIEQQSYRNQLQRASREPETHVTNLYAFSLELVTKVLQILSLMIILFAIEPLLFVLLLPLGIPFLIFQWRLSRRQFAELDSRVQKERWMSYYRGLLNDIDQAGEIRLLRLGPVIINRWLRIMNEFRSIRLNYQRFEFFGNLVFALFSIGVVYLALAHAMTRIAEGRLTIGDLAIFLGAATQLRSLIENSIVLLASLRWQLLNVEHLRSFFQIVPKAERTGGKTLEPVEGRIEFKDVGFCYPGTSGWALRHLSFSLEPGETVALVGANGAGKSTVVKLIAGFYQAQEGVIRVDGCDVRDLDTRQWQRQIACIFQQFGRYAATAADNIAFGDWQRLLGDATAIEAIARQAHVEDLIRDMPQGYQTLLGRSFGQYQPSGGQWQQLALARLIARDARIFILDEPTANLDITTEAVLFQEFHQLAAGRTTMLISHRFSTVSMADRILVMDKGRIVENGTHTELMALNGRYAALHRLAQRFREKP